MTTDLIIDLYPRDYLHRYRVYLYHDGDLDCVAACPDPGGIGEALVQLHADEREQGGTLSERGIVGVLDVLENDWIVKPFPRVRRG